MKIGSNENASGDLPCCEKIRRSKHAIAAIGNRKPNMGEVLRPNGLGFCSLRTRAIAPQDSAAAAPRGVSDTHTQCRTLTTEIDQEEIHLWPSAPREKLLIPSVAR